jgi:hypothetical protein
MSYNDPLADLFLLMSSHEPLKKSSKHTNSKSVSQLVQSIKTLEKDRRKQGVPITYPNDLEHEYTPMIGHTKGNTSSNRKVIKHHQVKELKK